MNSKLKEILFNQLIERINPSIEISDIKPLSGGSINSVYRIKTNLQKTFCVKVNRADKFPGMFKAEAEGLKLLSKHSSFHIPKVHSVFNGGSLSFLLLEFVISGEKDSEFWQRFGTSLAEMHQVNHSIFGLDHDNYIGSLPQQNKPSNTWESFFRERRLEPMVKMARDRDLLHKEDTQKFDRLYAKLTDLFPTEPPSLLHGDLWGGNYMVNTSGFPVLIDPAVYSGHREMDLSMMQLFGGFNHRVFDFYNEVYPLEEGWQDRVDLCNLYPLLVHVNLFGGGYVQQVRSALQKFL